MLIDNTSIAIVGGGPAGLTLARLLQLKNANVKVYERDPNKNARVQGSPLDMHENSGLSALRKADLLEEFKKTFRPGADKTLIMNEQAEIFFSDHELKPEEDFGAEHFRPEIDRGPLRNMLLESLHPETVVWDSHFLSMEARQGGWILHFKNGTSAYADLVIAADGAHSKIRPYLTEMKPIYSGIIMLEGNVSKEAAPHIDALIKGGKIMAFGNSKNILLGQKGNGDLGFYASFKADENWSVHSGLDFSDKMQVLKWFKTEYSEWNSIWDELFENAQTPFIPRPIYSMPLNQSWETKPNLTLLGDAAHVMPPFAGEGANMAMLDSLELSECLTNHTYSTLQEAISAYEIKMRKRAGIATQESLENGERMHSEKALVSMLKFFNGHITS
ncbi:2-polyprenyl-6-methoxyphenol hydroxylase-like FAD-dependent oxidoreductase [Chryseobacterium rhizosphaerae]|uniref:FAD-dependent oxidoreductase n=1 Tax=Chryseobacterium rhizosphaerae TaxID=395937 RepID=UPI000645563B|nr:NAD(P)/FAD-dependent oxidoreductase [Chryseobacterium rhizosphaerae]MDR6545133.1 2-polyprenyl-6-methoxyphenol hydroxylase-like FAD-dependent oxidoreductase [Chryseobacterium rhizosphaerae]